MIIINNVKIKSYACIMPMLMPISKLSKQIVYESHNYN